MEISGRSAFGISAGMGRESLGISFDYFLIPQLDIDVDSVKPVHRCKISFHRGGKNQMVTFHRNWIRNSTSYITGGNDDYSMGVIAVPVGVHFIQKYGFSFSIEVGLAFGYDKYFKEFVKFPSAGIHIGYHFWKSLQEELTGSHQIFTSRSRKSDLLKATNAIAVLPDISRNTAYILPHRSVSFFEV